MFFHLIEKFMIYGVLFCVCTEIFKIDQVLFWINEVLHIMTCLFCLSWIPSTFVGLIAWFCYRRILCLGLPKSQQKVILHSISRAKLSILWLQKFLLGLKMSISQIPLLFILQGLFGIIDFHRGFIA